uniref:Uncharacterized protein n=1 Tax=Acrobeloides nanus TaxID=290746 RepID=A0A914C6H9_9BILA
MPKKRPPFYCDCSETEISYRTSTIPSTSTILPPYVNWSARSYCENLRLNQTLDTDIFNSSSLTNDENDLKNFRLDKSLIIDHEPSFKVPTSKKKVARKSSLAILMDLFNRTPSKNRRSLSRPDSLRHNGHSISEQPRRRLNETFHFSTTSKNLASSEFRLDRSLCDESLLTSPPISQPRKRTTRLYNNRSEIKKEPWKFVDFEESVHRNGMHKRKIDPNRTFHFDRRLPNSHDSEELVIDYDYARQNGNCYGTSKRRGLPRYDAFVNSQEWTLSKTIQELKLGVVGSLASGKTSLVHRFLTGAFTPEESPEGGRFKKEIVLEGKSYLLLIRDEGSSPPEIQFTHWLDGVIIVFAVDNLESFHTAIQYYHQMSHFRNLTDVPVLLVGTQENVCESSPRVIKEEEARRMAHSLKMCNYYETCASYGLKVEMVFKEACQKILQQRRSLASNGRTPTPTTPSAHHTNSGNYLEHQFVNPYSAPNSKGNYYHQRSISAIPLQDPPYQKGSRRTQQAAQNSNFYQPPPSPGGPPAYTQYRDGAVSGRDRTYSAFAMPTPSAHYSNRASHPDYVGLSPAQSHNSLAAHHFSNGPTPQPPLYTRSSSNMLPANVEYFQNDTDNYVISTGQLNVGATASTSHIPTPSGTPQTQRKNRRISNIFRTNKEHHQTAEERIAKTSAEINMGIGRAIPIKQGLLYKRSSKTLNKEWKKKYVCLYPDGRLCYHPNLKDYMGKGHEGKEVYLGLATVRICGSKRPRATNRTSLLPQQIVAISQGKENIGPAIDPSPSDTKNGHGTSTPGDGTSGASDGDQQFGIGNAVTSAGIIVTPNEKTSNVVSTSKPATNASKKKRGHRRLGSGLKNGDDGEEETEFEIITYDQKRWEFSAASVEERDEWVALIEEQIEKSLQSQLSQKQQQSNRAHGDKAEVQALRDLPGNDRCADCNSIRPDWASVNLGTLICIECSGIHRNLGSHISKVRSLELDDWPIEYLAVMQAIGNDLANRVWEHNAPKDKRPAHDATREQKESWIKLKYEQKRFLPAVPVDKTLGRQLIDAVISRDLQALLTVLPRCDEKDVNCTVSARDRRTPIHLACSIGSVELLQLLIWYNADIYALDEMNRSALWHAQHNGSRECVAILIQAGLDPNYGMRSDTSYNTNQSQSSKSQNSTVSTTTEMITGSLANREFLTKVPTADSEAKFRRQSDVIVRRQGSAAGNSHPSGTQVQSNGYHIQRASDAFDRLPASAI